jgi:hypothetical protein
MDSLFVTLMKAALEKHRLAKSPDDRRAAEHDMALAIRRNYHGALDETFDPKMAQAGKDE